MAIPRAFSDIAVHEETRCSRVSDREHGSMVGRCPELRRLERRPSRRAGVFSIAPGAGDKWGSVDDVIGDRSTAWQSALGFAVGRRFSGRDGSTRRRFAERASTPCVSERTASGEGRK